MMTLRRPGSPSVVAEELEVSKLDVAERQLSTAIALHFARGDVVSIHTLAAATHEVLRALTKFRTTGVRTFRSEFLDRIEPSHVGEVRSMLDQPRNFFKHANRDADRVLTFRPVVAEWELIDCVELFEALTGLRPCLLMAYRSWWMAKNRDLLLREFRAPYVPPDTIDLERDRPQFLELFREAWSRTM